MSFVSTAIQSVGHDNSLRNGRLDLFDSTIREVPLHGVGFLREAGTSISSGENGGYAYVSYKRMPAVAHSVICALAKVLAGGFCFWRLSFYSDSYGSSSRKCRD